MVRGRIKATGRANAGSEATRARIIEATLATICRDGMSGATARAIARAGNFNQASIYYHFGSINEAVLAGLKQLSGERVVRYEASLAGVSTLSELVHVGAQLHREDVANGSISVLSQVLAVASGDELFAKELGETVQDWIDVLHGALQRVLGPSPVGALLPLGELAAAVSALFLGIELLGEHGASAGSNESLYTAVAALVGLVEAGPAVGSRPTF